MSDVSYAAHERIYRRKESLDPQSPDYATCCLYEELARHVIAAYPDPGPLRSMALRKIAESLVDVLDHAQEIQARRSRTDTGSLVPSIPEDSGVNQGAVEAEGAVGGT